eukprot:g5614.t1
MCASFAPPKPPSAFTVGKAGQESAGGSRRRQNSTPRRSRSPSPVSHESLNSIGGNAFSKEDFAKVLSEASLGGVGTAGFTTADGIPPPLSISDTPKVRGGHSFDRPGPLTAPATTSATAPLVSPTGNERPASFRSSPAGFAASSAGFAAVSPTSAASGAARSFTAASAASTTSATSRPVASIPTFSEIARGAMRAGGDLPLEPFARARIRATEERWERKDAERLEREKRRRVRVLSGATLFVLTVVLACRCIGVGITISGPAATAPTPPNKGKAGRAPSTAAPPQGFMSAVAGEMPVIASSKDEFVAALKLAGLKKPKPAQVDRAWSALASGENRGGGGGGVLAATLVIAGALRNPVDVAILAAALATLVLLSRRPRSWARSAVGSGGGEGGGRDNVARGRGAATNGADSPLAAGLGRPGSRGGAGGVGAMNGHAGNGCGAKSGSRVRGASSLSPR